MTVKLDRYHLHVRIEEGNLRIKVKLLDYEAYHEIFFDIHVRHKFIRQVYTILFYQILFSILVATFFRLYEPARIFLLTEPIFVYTMMGVSMASLLAIICCSNLRFNYPINYIVLGIFTFSLAVMLSVVTSIGETDILLMAAALTCGVCLVITLFAIQTKYDFTTCGVFLLILLIMLFVVGIVAAFVPNETLRITYAALGAIIFSLFLLYDTQLIIGGRHRLAIAPDEYILAAMHLYLDILQIFLYLYQLLYYTNN